MTGGAGVDTFVFSQIAAQNDIFAWMASALISPGLFHSGCRRCHISSTLIIVTRSRSKSIA